MNSIKSCLKLPVVFLFLSVIIPLLFLSVYAQTTNNMSVTATIPAQPSDFTATLTSPSGTDFNNGDIITYNLSYSTDLTSTSTITLQAEWYQGTIAGNPSPTVDIVDYLPGSATNGYNNTPPVIDTLNHTITWTISNFSSTAGTQTVSFQLKTTANYTGPSAVTFDVVGQLSALGVQTPNSKVTQNYTYIAPTLTPTLTPTSIPVTSAPGPSSSPTPGSGGISPTPTSTPTPLSLTIGSVTIETILSDSASASVITSTPSQIIVFYGTAPGNLTKTITLPDYSLTHSITFPNLTPDTLYFFKTRATDESGSNKTSDIYSFKTAVISTPVTIDLNTLVLTSKQNILLSPEATSSSSTQTQTIILPINTAYEFKFSLTEPSSVKNIRAFIRSKSKVLGINTFSSSTNDTLNTESVDLIENQPGVYSGRLKSHPLPGRYELVIQIQDTQGNLIQKIISEIVVVKPLTILDAITKKPLEGVRLLLFVKNRSTKKFEQVSSSIFAVNNPSFSDNNGEVPFVLPKGIYKASITALGYASKTVEFTIGDTSSTQYPEVRLLPAPFNFFNTIQFMWTTLSDFFSSLRASFLDSFGSSQRVFDILTLLSILTLVGLTLLSFITRTHITLSHIPTFIKSSITGIFSKGSTSPISGTVVDADTKLPISKATVYIMDEKTHTIVATLTTNSQGTFQYTGGSHYSVTIAKNGYEMTQEITLSENIQINLEKKAHFTRSFLHTIWWIQEVGLSFFFEFFLFASIVLELFFLSNFPLVTTIPIILITVLNCVLWLLYIHRSVINK